MHIVKENLKAFRKLKGITQNEMADRIGVTRQCYGHYEQGRRQPTIDLLRSICEVLECSSDELIGLEEK